MTGSGLHRLAWRGLRARPLRTGLTTLGVALGVAVLFAGLATDAGIEASVDRTVASVTGRADLRVAAFGEVGLSPATVFAIASSDGVEIAAPAFERRTYLGTGTFGPGPLPAPVTIAGIDPDREARIHDLSLAAGAPLDGDALDAALVSATLAREDGLSVGSEIGVQGVAAPVHLRVVGILAGDGPWSAGDGRVVVTGLDVARTVFGVHGVTRVDVLLESGRTSADVTNLLEERLFREPYVVSTPADLATSMRASTGEFAATTALIAAVALFAGAFLIFNTLSMTVVERVRELGLLRAAGAGRGQLTSYIVVQAALIGLAGSLVGVALGATLATAIATWMGTIGDVALAGPLVTWPDALTALAIGLVVTLAAAAEPARRAGRIPPVEAIRARLDLPTARRARTRWLVAVFGLVAVIGLLTWPRGAGEIALLRSLAVYGVLLIAAIAVPLALPALARVAGVPFVVMSRLEERLARAAVLRDRSRAALTVGALTVGLAMVVALGGVGQHARAAAGAWLEDVVPGDLVLTSIFPRGLDEGLDTTLASLPGVAAVSPIATIDLAASGARLDGAAMVGSDLAADGRLRLLAGDRATAFAALDAGGSVILPAAVADRLDLPLEATLSVTGADGAALPLRVVAIAERTLPAPGGEAVLVSWADAAALGIAGADAFAVRLTPDAPAGDRAALADTARSLALEPADLDRIEGAIGGALERVFGLFDVLSLIAVIVAALGIVNTLTMNVLERVREIGVLRAAGMTRDQVWRSVIVEAGITGLVGAGCGVVTGIGISSLMVVMSGGRWDPGLAVPWLAVGVALVLGVALAMLAAAYPARLASRLSIVRAVAYE